MSEADKFLELRARVKSRKPTFVRHDAHKKKRVGNKWRRARGIQSKMRLGLRSYKKGVQTGYGSPKLVKGLHKTGLKSILVNSVSDVAKLDAKKEAIVVAKGVGLKKRVEIVKHAQQQRIKVLNIKDPAKFLSDIEEIFKKKKEKKEEKTKEKKKKKEEKEKKAVEKEKEEKKPEEKETIESIAEEEDTKMKEKKELDKALTKKEK